MSSSLTQLRKGFRAAIPIIIGYIPIAVSFGIISAESDLPVMIAVFMSATVFAGASQFMAVGMLSMETPILEIIIATLFMNLRHFVMTLSLLPKLENVSKVEKSLISLGITDETFAVASLSDDNDIRNTFGMIGLTISAFLTWVGCTFLGAWAAFLIPQTISKGMSVALYAMFIALLVPALKQKKKYVLVVAVAIAINLLLQNFVSAGWSLVIAIILGSLFSPLLERGGSVAHEK